ncbi:hypothetical protein K5X82_07690 [Halosquirtibacter xylanolyticus]|uniref:hypothetical protein n=1 Tax=Halosquirtibacter xylanolyticus TaxID=3374599 RepID=UPI0037480FDE|nr:hypothetical protein K5X82_07690 [Prolixibacteraceae bacterium]
MLSISSIFSLEQYSVQLAVCEAYAYSNAVFSPLSLFWLDLNKNYSIYDVKVYREDIKV